MRLDLSEIKAVTVGAIDVFSENGGVAFSKMTAEQSACFAGFSEGLYERSLTTTGIRLDLHTDSPYLRFAVLTEGKYEVAIDGLLATPEARRAVGVNYEIPLSDGSAAHRVTLYLPSHTRGVLSYVELADGASLRRHVFDRRLLFVGDSITQGWNAEYDSLSFAYQTSELLNAESFIQGVGGAFYDAGFIGRIPYVPDAVIVAYGTNDADRTKSIDVLRESCIRFFERTRELYPKSTLFVITPPWRMDCDRPRPYGKVRLVSDAIAEVARTYGARVIDGMTLMPHLPCMMADTVHPNALGFSVYAMRLTEVLRRK